MNRLSLSDASAGTVTLHEPCKSAYTEVDLNGPREVLRQLPGVTLNEMEHHGKPALSLIVSKFIWLSSQIANHHLMIFTSKYFQQSKICIFN
jgi:hypothetical protein